MKMTEVLDGELRRASAAQRVKMERALSSINLTPAQFAMLEWLEQEPGLSGAELARREKITPPTSSVIVANLEHKGLLVRQQRSGGGRAQYLVLTTHGRSMLAKGKNAVSETRKRLDAGLDPKVFQALLSWLKQIAGPAQ